MPKINYEINNYCRGCELTYSKNETRCTNRNGCNMILATKRRYKNSIADKQ